MGRRGGSTWRLIAEDWRARGETPTALLRPSMQAVAVYRMRRAVRDPERPLLKLIADGCGAFVRTFYLIHLDVTADIGRRFVVVFHPGVLVGPGVELGDDCVVHRGVMIGNSGPGQATVLGDDVTLGPGAVVTPGVRIGDHARVAPNAVVTADIPEHGQAAAPASTVKTPREEAAIPAAASPSRPPTTPLSEAHEQAAQEMVSASDPSTFADLLAVIRQDREAQGAGLVKLARPGFHAIIVYRLGRWVRQLQTPIRRPLAVLHGLLYWLIRALYQIELPSDTVVGSNLVIGHQGGIVISQYSTIGDNCLIRHNVTIGGKQGYVDAPTLGNDVSIGPGAAIIGPIHVGDGAKIGPNAVVMRDVPAGARVLAPRAEVQDDDASAIDPNAPPHAS